MGSQPFSDHVTFSIPTDKHLPLQYFDKMNMYPNISYDKIVYHEQLMIY